ncbi:hypothetical protein GCM10010302_75450 [Streptomyces polychromogenes]|uniref:Transposase IS4 N-terminal domain-containing protein n=2 Tax=Streptomyces TaxID=1883 RepID=A0ABP3FVX7_9ACTN
MVYFVLARALFCGEPYREVLRMLAEAVRREDGWGAWRLLDKAAVFRALRNLGVEPLRELLLHAGAAVADERTPGAFGGACGRWRSTGRHCRPPIRRPTRPGWDGCGPRAVRVPPDIR